MKKIILKIVRYVVLTIFFAIFAWMGYYAFIGLLSAEPSEDWSPGETYPY